MRGKNGISLIVLVITIIVMIILAATVVISLTNTNIINRANTAVNVSNEKQMQTVALTIWADAYMEGKRGDELVNEIEEGLLEIDANYKEKYDVIVSDTGVSLNLLDNSWETVVKGPITSENGEAIVSKTHLFNTKSKYKVTLTSDEYTGTFETELIQFMSESEIYYLAGVVYNNEIITFSNIIEAQNTLNSLEGDYTTIIGINEGEGENKISLMMFDGATCEYTINIIMKKEIHVAGKKIYEGIPTTAMAGTFYNIENIELNPEKCYTIECEYGYYDVEFVGSVESQRMVFMGDTMILMDNISKTMQVGLPDNITNNVIIYETKKNSNVIMENENILLHRDSKWILVSGSGSVPSMVAGQKVDAVSSMVGKIYYEGNVELLVEPDPFFIEVNSNIIVANTVDQNVVFNAIKECTAEIIPSLTVDMTAFEDLTIPAEIMGKITQIYVNESVKAKYPDDSRIKIKSE